MQGVIGDLGRASGYEAFDLADAVVGVEVDVAPVLGGLSLGYLDDEDVLESGSFGDEMGKPLSRVLDLVAGRQAPEFRKGGDVVGVEDDAFWSSGSFRWFLVCGLNYSGLAMGIP